MGQARASGASWWGLGFLSVGLALLLLATQIDSRGEALKTLMRLGCGGVFSVAIGVALILQFRRDRIDREAEKRSHVERGDRIFHVLIQVPQQVGKEDKLRSALDLATSEVHRGIAPLMEACAHADAVRIEVRELADIDQDLEVYASDVMRKALHPFGEEVQTYRETAETTKDGYLTLVTWLLLVQLPTTPWSAPLGHGELRAWLDALIPPHPEDTLSSQVACSIRLHDIELTSLENQETWRHYRV